MSADIETGPRRSRAARLLLYVGAAAAIAVVVAVLGGVFLASLALVQSAQRSRATLSWLAPVIVGMCLLVVVVTLAEHGRRDRRGRRHLAAVERALHELRGSLASSSPGWRRLLARLELAHEASSALSPAERERVVEGLRAIGAARLLQHRLAHTRKRWDRARQLTLLGWLGAQDAIPTLRAVAGGPDPDLAFVAAQALACHPTRAAYETLLDALASEWLPRARVAALLEGSRYPTPVVALAPRAADPDPQMRFWIAYLLGRSGAQDALATLEMLARDPQEDVRANAAEAFGAVPGHAPLATLLEDPSWVVRAHAAKAAGHSGRLDLAPRLVGLLSDRAWWVRQDATLALKQLGAPTIETVRAGLGSEDRFARNKAAEVLVDLGYAAAQLPRLRGNAAERQAAAELVLELGRAEALAALKVETLAECPPSARGALEARLAEASPDRLAAELISAHTGE